MLNLSEWRHFTNNLAFALALVRALALALALALAPALARIYVERQR
jgi:hypothetical protein